MHVPRGAGRPRLPRSPAGTMYFDCPPLRPGGAVEGSTRLRQPDCSGVVAVDAVAAAGGGPVAVDAVPAVAAVAAAFAAELQSRVPKEAVGQGATCPLAAAPQETADRCRRLRGTPGPGVLPLASMAFPT